MVYFNECILLHRVNYICFVFSRSFERTIPIWFKKVMNKDNDQTGNFIEAKNTVFSLATTNSITDIVAMSTRINDESVSEHVEFFTKLLGGLPPRLSANYCVFRLISHLVRTKNENFITILNRLKFNLSPCIRDRLLTFNYS